MCMLYKILLNSCERSIKIYHIFAIAWQKFQLQFLYQQQCVKNGVAQKYVVTLLADIFGPKKFCNGK